jgi:hypothetical protein
MLKEVLLAWKLCGKRRVVGVAILGGYVSTGIYRRQEREETDKYMAIICNTEHDMLECSAGLPKSMSKPF